MGRPKRWRSTITEDEFGGFRVVIPVGPKWFFRLFLPAWLCFWLIPEVLCLKEIVSGVGARGSLGFVFLWFCAWSTGGCLAALSLAWNWFGREVVVIDDRWMETRRELFGLSRSRTFELAEVRGLRYAPSPYNAYSISRTNNWQQWGFGRGTIAIDHNEGPPGSTLPHYFGDQLPEAEALRVIQAIQQQYPFPETRAAKPAAIER